VLDATKEVGLCGRTPRILLGRLRDGQGGEGDSKDEEKKGESCCLQSSRSLIKVVSSG